MSSRYQYNLAKFNEEIGLRPNLKHSQSPSSNLTTIPLSTSPTQKSSSSSLIHEDSPTLHANREPAVHSPSESVHKPTSQRSTADTRAILWTLAKRSGGWALLGISTMLLGIGIAYAAILPKIHTCPPNGSCPGSLDPNTTNVLSLLQAGMTYWLKCGMILTGVGLLRLSAYQSWFILIRHGNTIENLDYNLGAIKGGLMDALRLVLRKGNTWLSVLILSQLAVDTAISLIAGVAIDRAGGERAVTFNYLGVSRMPDSSLSGMNSDVQVRAAALVEIWAMDNDTTHGGALRGSLVIPDGRSNASVRAVPGGPRISGDIECTGYDNHTANPDNPSAIDIFIGASKYIALPSMQLAVAMTSLDTSLTRYLWVSNTTGLLPNASTTADGRMSIARCTHHVYMHDTPTSEGAQYIAPNEPTTSGCKLEGGLYDANVCVADAVNNAVLNWWGGTGTAFWRVSCRGGVLGPIKSNGTTPACALSAEVWTETLTSMLDGIMQAAPRTGPVTQRLVAGVQVVHGGRWWLLGVVPAGAVLVYLAALGYTWRLSGGEGTLKELNLAEVIGAAQTEHVRALVGGGRLGRSVVRYGSGVGFGPGESQVPYKGS